MSQKYNILIIIFFKTEHGENFPVAFFKECFTIAAQEFVVEIFYYQSIFFFANINFGKLQKKVIIYDDILYIFVYYNL